MDEPTPPVRFTRTADGVSIAYKVWPGTGVPFLRIRSLGGVPMTLEGTKGGLHRFAGDRPMVWFDWRGTGQSAKQLPASIDDLLLDIDAVMSVIDSDAVDVFAPGSCFLACAYAASRGERWRSLMLTDPTSRLEGSPQGLHLRPGWENDFEGFLTSMAHRFLPHMSKDAIEQVVRSWAEAGPIEAWRAFIAIEREVDLADTLGALDMPVLILRVSPRSRADSVAALIPNSILLEHRSGLYGRHLREQWDQYIGSRFADPPQAAATGASFSDLSPRELEVLALLARGDTNPVIADALGLSARTVERHLQNIYNKLGLHNRVEAANWAREHRVL